MSAILLPAQLGWHTLQNCHTIFYYFNTCTVHFLLFCKITNKSAITINLLITTHLHVSTLSCHLQGARIPYVPGKNDSSINIQTVHTATTQADFVIIVTMMILPHFISNWTTEMF